MAFAAGNAQHIGSRPQQQDSFGFSDPGEQAFVAHGGFLGIVADGVGGLTHGSEASQSAVRAFLRAYHLKSPVESIPSALVRSLHEANAAVLRVASEPSGEGAGTTLVAAVLHEHSLYWVSAGDSRIYLLRSGRLTRVTSDHTYARQLDEQAAQGKISRAEAQSHSERGSLTSYLGQAEPQEVDRNTRPLALQPDDVVIACSDGFYRALDNAEILAAFPGDLQKGCDNLVGQVLAKQRKGQDNLTVIALKQGRRTQKVWRGRSGGKSGRVRRYAIGLAMVALFSTAVGYWYEKRSEEERQIHPAAKSANREQQDNAAGKEGNMKPSDLPPAPAEDANQPVSAKPVKASNTKQSATKTKTHKHNPPKAKNNSKEVGAQTTVNPEPTAITPVPAPDHGASGSATNSPDAQPPAQPNPVAPAPTPDDKSSPATTAPPGNDQPPPSPPPATNNVPPNLASLFVREIGEIVRPDGGHSFLSRQLGWTDLRKDGDSCHS